MQTMMTGWVLAALVLPLAGTQAFAQQNDTLKLAVGQRGNWDTSVAEIGQRAGIFKKHGLTLEILNTQGGGETQQAVISGSVDIGVAAGTMGALSAFAKGAPVRILSAETTGAADLYWYVRADSPIKSLKDTDDKTMAYSTSGSSTHGVVVAYVKQYGIKPKLTATGGPPGTLTQVMSGQIDVGWAAPPFGLDQLDQKQIRILATGNDAEVFKGQTVRINITNVQTLQTKKPVLDRFMKAYRETVDFMYADDKALQIYADWLGITVEKARRTRDGFFPKASVDPDTVVGLEAIVRDAVELKYLPTALTKAQLDDLLRVPPR